MVVIELVVLVVGINSGNYNGIGIMIYDWIDYILNYWLSFHYNKYSYNIIFIFYLIRLFIHWQSMWAWSIYYYVYFKHPPQYI